MEFPLAGNLNIKDVLNNAFNTGHIPHAIIIEGEEGLGKTTLARFIAKSCVCQSQNVPCGSCNGCHMADLNTHPDIFNIAPEENRKNIDIAQIRSLRSEAYVMSQISKRKVFLINKADTMNANSANALLKVLEDPPGGAVFILITAYSASLLPTVRSRCITLSLVPPPFEDAVAAVKKLSTATDEQIASALGASNCNIGKALSIINCGNALLSDSVAEKFYNSYLAGDEYSMLLALHSLEKDRVAAAEFFVKIKVKIAEHIKIEALNYKDTSKWYKMYAILSDASEALTYNISLPLLFAQVCAAISVID